MNKLELIQALKDATDLSKSEAAAVIDNFFNGMANALANGDRVEIRGLGSFFVKQQDPSILDNKLNTALMNPSLTEIESVNEFQWPLSFSR